MVRVIGSKTSLSARKHTKSESYPERLTLFLFYGCYFFVVCNFVICNMLQALLPKKYPISTTWHTLLRVLISRCNVLCTLSLCSKNQAKISGKLFDIYRHVSVTYRWLTEQRVKDARIYNWWMLVLQTVWSIPISLIEELKPVYFVNSKKFMMYNY